MTPPCLHWLNPLPPCPCGHSLNLEKIRIFLHKKCGCSHLQTLPPCLQHIRTGQWTTPLSDCGHLLCMVPYCNLCESERPLPSDNRCGVVINTLPFEANIVVRFSPKLCSFVKKDAQNGYRIGIENREIVWYWHQLKF